jgi:uncharacterized damage-inducible protein DinB
MEFPQPTGPVLPRNEVFLQYLDYLRGRVIEKVDALPLEALIVSVVPTDWTALELVKHLTYVEMRWLEWGFEGHHVDEPWGDHVGDHWGTSLSDTPEALLDQMRARGELTAAIVRRHGLEDSGQPGPRWDGAEPPTLERVLFHLFQEYARHLGHLDVYAELAGAAGGE